MKQTREKLRAFLPVALGLLFALISSVAFAQERDGNIEGKVTDS